MRHHVLARGEAVAGRTIDIFIHHRYINANSNGGQVDRTRAIHHTC